MGRLFTSTKYRFIRRNEDGEVIKQWPMSAIDLTAKVVCKACNEGWMSNLEQRHAMPAMTDLIIGKTELISLQLRTDAIARFAFKTAVIIDHMQRDEPFFPRSARHHFAKSLKIPRDVRMWIAGYLPMSSGSVNACYHGASVDSNRKLDLYVCTYAVGHLAFQVVAAKCTGIRAFDPRPGFEYSAVPIWPAVPQGVSWPPSEVIRTKADFQTFSDRWETIGVRA